MINTENLYTEKPTKWFNFRLKPTTAALLDALAEHYDTSKTAVIERTLATAYNEIMSAQILAAGPEPRKEIKMNKKMYPSVSQTTYEEDVKNYGVEIAKDRDLWRQYDEAKRRNPKAQMYNYGSGRERIE